ncbi:hypothetical protein KCU65_g4399, partial [Aureobasidium melanogenum]
MNNAPGAATRDESQSKLIDSHIRLISGSENEFRDDESSQAMDAIAPPGSVSLHHGSESSLRSSSETTDQQRRQLEASQHSTIRSEWAFEIIASVCSILCFIALITVLEVSRGKEPQFWLGGRITLNGLVALISAIARASIMVSVAASLSQLKWNRFAHESAESSQCLLGDLSRYDKASRGPWGSFKLLVRPHIGLGMVGALITISTLAFDFFAQQVTIVHYRSTALSNGTLPGAISRSEEYSRADKNGISVISIPDSTATAAMHNAILNPQTIIPPPAQCSSGDCTWPAVSSLAVCGACTDISDTVVYVCRTQPGYYQNCTYTIPEGNLTYSLTKINATWAHYGNDALKMYELSDQASVYNDAAIGYIKKYVVVDSTYRFSNQIEAHTCALWWCVQTYHNSVQRGVHTEEIVATYNKADQALTSSSAYTTYSNITGFSDADANVPAGTNFSWSIWTTFAYEQTSFFESTTAYPSTAIFGEWEYRDDWGRYLMKETNWSSFTERMAMSMTNNIRATGKAATPESRYQGQTWAQLPYIHVRWAWLAFPASLILASIGLLLACMWDTKRKRMPTWKDDALALLFCRTDPDISDYFTNKSACETEPVLLDLSEVIPIMRRARTQSDTEMMSINHDETVV